jgi:serine/threonine protein phosphatase PrpC
VTGFDEIQFSTLSDVGLRRSHNQDAHAAIPAKNLDAWQSQGHVFLVADGMGGHAVGEKASAKAVRDIPLTYLKHASDGVANALRRAFVETNAGIHAIGQKNLEFKGLGTTATALVIRPDGAWFAHVGDSRGYRIRDGEIQQLTFDHSYIWEMARRQNVSPEEITGFKANVIIRSLGPDALVQVDIEGPHPIRAGDTFVLCSDGLTGPVSDSEIGAVASLLPPDEACRFLVALANLRGGPDNITVQIVRIGGGGDPSKKPSSLATLAKVHWSIPVLGGGVLLTLLAIVLAIVLVMEFRALTLLLFLLATGATTAGFVGLFLHAKAEKLRRSKEPPPPNINVYRRHSCEPDAPVVEKLANANVTLLERIREISPDLIPASYQLHFDRGETLRAKADWPEAFREYVRAMHDLAESYNKTRHKQELFQPLWDKPK